MPVSNTSPNIQLWATGAGGGHGLFRINGDPEFAGGMTGFELAQYYENTTDLPGTVAVAEGLYRPSDMVFDTVHGKFFIADSDLAGHNRILQGNIADLIAGNPPALTVLYEDLGAGAGTRIDNLEIDPDNGIVYFTHGDNLEKVLYDNPNQSAVLLFNANVTAGSSPSGVANPAGSTNNSFNDLVINFATGEIYLSSTRVLVGGSGDVVQKNFIYQLTGLTPTSGTDAFTFGVANSGTARLLPVSPNDDTHNPNPGTTASPAIAVNEPFFFPVEFGSIDGMALDPTTNILYFSTGSILFDHDVNSGTPPIFSPGGIFSYALTGNPTGTYTQIYQQNALSGPQGLLGDLEIDPTTGRWYVTDYTGGTAGAGDEGIWTGNLDGTGTPTLFSLVNNAGGLIPAGLTLNIAPTLVGTETGATATEDGGPGSGFSSEAFALIAVDSGDFENADQADQLSGAQVRISAGFGSSPGSVEQLTIGGSTAGVLGSGIAYSYNGLTGVMTLSGVNSFANYEAALALVAYSISGDDPDAGGTSTARTLSYSVHDGLLASDEYDSVITIAGTNDGPVNTTGGATAANEDDAAVAITGLSVADADSGTLTVTLSVARGTINVAPGAAVITGNGTGTVEITGSQSDINAMLAAVNGVTYTPTPNVNGADTLTMTSDDGTDQDVDIEAINVAAVNDAPTVAGDGTEDAAPIVQDMPSPVGQSVASLFGGQYSDATDQVAGGSSADPFVGVAVTANGSSGATGQWQYYNGISWVNIGPASDGSAVLLSASTSVRFNPAAGFTGSAPTLTARLVDGSGGALTSGTVADASVNGGTSRYSGGTVTLGQTVLVGNTAPTGVNGTLAVIEDANNGTTVGTVTAVDPDSSTFTYSLVNDAGGRFNISSAGVVTVENGLLLDYEQNSSHVIRVRIDDNEGGVSEFDMNVTINDDPNEFVTGDGANHTYYGGAGIDFLFGGHGSDTIRGQGGIDFIFGGDGLYDPTDGGDNLGGGSGSDVILGNGGDDIIAGGTESDVLSGNEGNDTIYGGESVNDAVDTGSDIISGDAGNDFLYGNGGNDIILGGTENDQLYGGAGSDDLDGGSGVDRLDGGAGADDLTGGSGFDVFVFRKGQANGDEIFDFDGNGSGAGDTIRLEGYAAGTTFTKVGGDTWKINDHGSIEYVTINSDGNVHATDWGFFP